MTTRTQQLGTGRRGEVDLVRASFLDLVERFRPHEARDVAASWVVEVDGHAPTTIRVQHGRCLVSPGRGPDPDTRLVTDADTWVGLVDGHLDGIGAFLGGRLRVEGDLHLAARFETMFSPGPAGTRQVRALQTDVRGLRIESLVAGSGQPVVLLHGLGANKVSFLPTLDGLSDRFEVHALDLPGFGRSSKPLPAGRRYSMAWMAHLVHRYLVHNGLEGAFLVGNSMGGRIAVEVALGHPGWVRGVVGLAPAVAFDEYRRLAPLLRWTRAHWVGLAPMTAPLAWIEELVQGLFHDPSTVPTANHRAAALDVVRAMHDPAYRMALLACARHIAVERATGPRSYWSRLAGLATPSYWIFGRGDRLVDPRYTRRVGEVLPAARVELWDDVGHVPQFEVPVRTNAAIAGWFDTVGG